MAFCVLQQDYLAVESAFSGAIDWREFGIEDGHIPSYESDNNVEVPEVTSLPTEVRMQQLQAQIDPLSDDDNHGINLYVSATRLTELILSL